MEPRRASWPEQLRVTLGYADRTEQVIVPLDGARAEAREAVGKPAPLYVLPNGGGWAYGAFVLDPASLAYLSQSLPDIADPLTRGAAWVTLWEAMLESRGAAGHARRSRHAAPLPRETDEQLTSRVLGYLRGAWWRFLTPAERDARQASVEALLQDRPRHPPRRPARSRRGSARSATSR